MKPWLLDILACPAGSCGGRLCDADADGEGAFAGTGRDGLLRCEACEALYPVLGGVPILTPVPGHWLATYRESAIAALAEFGAVSRRTVELVEEFAAPHEGAEPLRFGDDWVAAERAGSAVLPPPAGDGPPVDAYRAFLERAQSSGPATALLALLGDAVPGAVLELGPGAGLLTRSLAARARRLVVADLSLRAVLLSIERTGDRSGAVAGAVAEAETLRLHPGAVEAVVAANVIDLLDDPEAFLGHVAEALPERGRLLLSTPDPDLGFPPAEHVPAPLDRAIAEAGLEILTVRDGIPWVRAHTRRRHEVYFVRTILARKAR